MPKPDILRYEWIHEGQPSETAVDLNYAQDAGLRKDLEIFLRISAMPRKESESNRLNPLEEFLLGQLHKKIERTVARAKCAIPGVRHYGSVLCVFCYCPTDEAADKVADVVMRARWATVDFEQKRDPDWTIYFNELYPTAAQRQTVKNEETIDLMLRYDDDLHAPRRVDHYCTFRDEVSRIGFQEDARKNGFALGDPYFAPDTDHPHGAVVRNLGAINKRAIDEWTTKIIALVDKYDGSYCGWDAPVRRKKRVRDKLS